jgi:lysophospholipase
VLQRAKERAGVEIGDQCQQCFNEYCWDGTINTTANAYNPVLKSNNATFTTEGQAGVGTSTTSGAVRKIKGVGLGVAMSALLSMYAIM